MGVVLVSAVNDFSHLKSRNLLLILQFALLPYDCISRIIAILDLELWVFFEKVENGVEVRGFEFGLVLSNSLDLDFAVHFIASLAEVLAVFEDLLVVD